MAENTDLINTNNNKHQINPDSHLLGLLDLNILAAPPSILPQRQEDQSLVVNIEIKTNNPEDLLPKLEVLGFSITQVSDANSFTGIIDRDSLTQIIPLASQVTFPSSPSDPNSEVLVAYSTATDPEAASLINLDDFQQDARFAGIDGSGYLMSAEGSHHNLRFGHAKTQRQRRIVN